MLRKFFSKAALTLMLFTGTAGTLVVRAQDLNSTIPVDSKVTIGKLPNGLTYYIRPNSKPEKKVELRLVVNAGSILETDKQQGLAHFMEHMNFNGTKNFPKNKLVDFLQSLGIEFGADLNAYTSFDETVYILPIPTDRPGNLESGFQVIGDWAHAALLEASDIDEERGVVLEESRGRKGAQDRMMQKWLPEVLAGSQYANRLPIGKDDILKNFKHEEVRSFYRDWYRPNLMAVAVVGDVTVAEAEALIKKYFGGIKNPTNAPERKSFDIKPYTGQKTMVLTDKEATNTMFQLMLSPKKEEKQVLLKDYRESILESMFGQMLNSRFQELARSANPPFAIAYGYAGGGFARGYENFNLVAIPTTDVAASINAAIAEVVKVQQFGFNNSELELAKKQMLSSMEKAFNERNTTESGRIVDEYVRNFLEHEPIPGIEQEYKYYQTLLPGITIEEVNAVAKKWINKAETEKYFAMITAPEAKLAELPTDVELKELINRAFTQKVTANAEKVVVEKLLDHEPVAGKITGESKDADLGTTTFTLSNGVKVTVKKTDFKSDEIKFSAVKKGGESNYGAADRSNTKFLGQVIEAMGYGQFTPTALTDALAGKNVGLMPQFEEVHAGLSGSSSVKDFETLLELNYLQLTQPREDAELFNAFVSTMKMQLQFLSANPQVAFVDTLIKTVYNNSPMRPIQVPTVDDIAQIDMKRVLDIYKNEFSNADGFHFFIVGNVDEATLKPLLEKYIASLPAKGTTPTFKDKGVRMFTGNKNLAFKKGSEPKSLVITGQVGEMEFSEDAALHADMIGQILTIKVLEEIREKMGAMYSGGVEGRFEQFPYPHYSFLGTFPCGPENVDAILKQADKEIADLKANGPEQKNLDKVKQAIIEKRKENIKTNEYWAGKLEQLMVWNRSKQRFLDFDKVINSITVNDIKASANKMLNNKNTIDAVLYPEDTK
jgi:zinc protease